MLRPGQPNYPEGGRPWRFSLETGALQWPCDMMHAAAGGRGRGSERGLHFIVPTCLNVEPDLLGEFRTWCIDKAASYSVNCVRDARCSVMSVDLTTSFLPAGHTVRAPRYYR